jgi:hypothetical protein
MGVSWCSPLDASNDSIPTRRKAVAHPPVDARAPTGSRWLGETSRGGARRSGERRDSHAERDRQGASGRRPLAGHVRGTHTGGPPRMWCAAWRTARTSPGRPRPPQRHSNGSSRRPRWSDADTAWRSSARLAALPSRGRGRRRQPEPRPSASGHKLSQCETGCALVQKLLWGAWLCNRFAARVRIICAACSGLQGHGVAAGAPPTLASARSVSSRAGRSGTYARSRPG